VAPRSFNRLAHRFRDFVRLPSCEADASLSVSDSDERVEREATTALHDFGDAIDRDDVLDQLGAALARLLVATAVAALGVASTLAAATAWAAASAPTTATWAATAAASSTTATATLAAASARTTASATGASARRPTYGSAR
jgi:hypothetical protein